MRTTTLLAALALLAGCNSPFAGPDPGETAVAMHAAGFVSDNSTMEERQARFHRMQAMFPARNQRFAR